MLEIDKKLGGTTPFDIIIDKPKLALDEKIIGEQDDDMEFDELSELFGEEDEI